jgi:lipopolysaccharide export system protein LptA
MILRTPHLFFILALVFGLVSVVPNAFAQGNFADSLGGLSNKNDGPIEITANSNEMDRTANVMTFKDNVVVKRGDVTLTSSNLKVFFRSDVSDISRIEATGKVTVASADQKATSDRADFDVIGQVIVMRGNVFLMQGPNKAEGSTLTVDLAKGTSKLESKGRVRAIFTPESAPKR